MAAAIHRTAEENSILSFVSWLIIFRFCYKKGWNPTSRYQPKLYDKKL